MKFGIRRAAALAVLALSSCLVPAFAAPDQALLRKVLGVTGIERQFSDLSGAILAMYQQQQQQLPGEAYGKIVDIIGQSFGGANFNDIMLKQMSSDYREDYCRAIERKYESKLFLDMTAREIDAMRPEEIAKMGSLDYSKVGAPRDALFEAFIADSKSLENQARISSSAIRAFIYTYNILLPEGGKIGKEVEAQAIDASNKAVSSPEARLQLKKYMAIIYEPFTDAQLKEYFAFYSSAEGKWLHEALLKSFDKGFADAMTDAANKLKQSFNIGA